MDRGATPPPFVDEVDVIAAAFGDVKREVPVEDNSEAVGGALIVTESAAAATIPPPPPSPLLLFFMDVAAGAACVSDSASEAEGGAVPAWLDPAVCAPLPPPPPIEARVDAPLLPETRPDVAEGAASSLLGATIADDKVSSVGRPSGPPRRL